MRSTHRPGRSPGSAPGCGLLPTECSVGTGFGPDPVTHLFTSYRLYTACCRNAVSGEQPGCLMIPGDLNELWHQHIPCQSPAPKTCPHGSRLAFVADSFGVSAPSHPQGLQWLQQVILWTLGREAREASRIWLSDSVV